MSLRSEQKNNALKYFDAVYINPDFENLSEAIQKQTAGAKVFLLFENELERKDCYIITSYFPLSFWEIFRLKKTFSRWQKVMNFAPHLFQSQKVIYPQSGISERIKAKIADFLLNNNYEKRATSLVSDDVKDFMLLKKTFKKAIYFQEYKFNISRFYIEILKHFVKMGGELVIDTPIISKDKLTVHLKNSEIIEAKEFIEPKPEPAKTFVFPFQILSHFSMVIKIDTGFVRISDVNGNLLFEDLKKENIQFSVNEIEKILRNNLNLSEKQRFEILHSLQFNLINPHKILSALKNVHLPVFENFNGGNNHELCLEKFDIAKQTGINYEDFKTLFHRYGKEIDELIDLTYEFMNKTRESSELWKMAESCFQQKREWKKEK